MSSLKGATIKQVKIGSLAAKIGLLPGDQILDINESPVQDLIDYHYLTAGEHLKLTVRQVNGEVETIILNKAYDEDLGLEFSDAVFDGLRRCQNRCSFCFIDQLPFGMRPSLYEKDDDYRLSFLHGTFITLTNLREKDLKRIIQWRLSPLYISVHTTDPLLRASMMGNPRATKLEPYLKALTAGGITLHLQLVLCPGLNNGPQLDRTLEALGKLGLNLASVGLVPVGLTRFREGLPALRTFTKEEAQACIMQAERWQTYFLTEQGRRLVFLADEFYLLAERDFPAFQAYEDFPQSENGIGLARKFLDEFARLEPIIPPRLEEFRSVLLLTGRLGYPVLKRCLPSLEKIGNLQIDLKVVDNRFFGEKITVTGLLTGRDLLAALLSRLNKARTQKTPAWSQVVLPDVMLKADSTRFLDDLTVAQLEEQLGIPVGVARTHARGLIEAVLNKKLEKKKRTLKRNLR